MGPNLTRLFQIANRGTGFSLETQLTSEKMLRKLFMCHGEALIAALDEFNTWYGMKGWDARELELTDRISKLLAQLEAEAQL